MKEKNAGEGDGKERDRRERKKQKLKRGNKLDGRKMREEKNHGLNQISPSSKNVCSKFFEPHFGT